MRERCSKLAEQATDDSGLDEIDGEPRMWTDPVAVGRHCEFDRGHRDPITGEPYGLVVPGGYR